ncbi:ankycorbin [Biomphalaria pfeifferi]|uniref:Ankycorbin n=1 Tax=Biomphalaria pfeifferi TaxID=112525 RepID=A0AAD8C633_BIOPF|nr:ankycorbin [Biomphalaria pfeifferi]
MFASEYGHFRIVEKILRSKSIADINQRNQEGRAALMPALKYGHIKVVNILLKYNADIYLEDNKGCTALMFAAENGKKENVLKLLQKEADVNKQNVKNKDVRF